ncbi:5-formyltetrahydrofolate cyclo-ligase [Phascolomyces articulosus]|uniref:5-formyltetrahydrofolate cyclo-ligase n=1 Tax=Phascolomyces articulosus TaxID=60185 RepID=A0AAD5K2U0_9FUNG|nr:5-formyltetrahydrofolate cyclo-ligase [Phascolomyces articulosus]
MASTVVALKRALRKELKTTLGAVSQSTITSESEKVIQKLFNLEAYRASRNVSVYINLPSGEIETRAIIHHILHSDKSCYVPRWTKDTMEMVKIKSWDEYLALPVNKWNIPEPSHEQEMERALEKEGLDLIIVPAMAFDIERNRIGHGKGYYDKYLRACGAWAAEHNQQPPKTVGVALSAQLLEAGRIPVEPTDQKIDCILSPDKVIE